MRTSLYIYIDTCPTLVYRQVDNQSGFVTISYNHPTLLYTPIFKDWWHQWDSHSNSLLSSQWRWWLGTLQANPPTPTSTKSKIACKAFPHPTPFNNNPSIFSIGPFNCLHDIAQEKHTCLLDYIVQLLFKKILGMFWSCNMFFNPLQALKANKYHQF